ncbi:MAG: hypothetical protein KAS23_05770 [Anaerohalosphaera sp.]|nr:hypothetical protein [Anaerohalosphaera sp.]
MKKILCVVVLLAMAACVQAGLNSPVLVNPSFEDPELADAANSNDINDWFDGVGYTYTQDDANASHPETPYGDNWSEFGQRRWMYQQVGTYDANMDIEISFLMGARSDKGPSPVVVGLLVGGNPALAADLNTQFYVADFGNSSNPLVGIVGASLIETSGEIAPFSGTALATSEQTITLSTGTGYTVGDPLWLQIYCPLTAKGRLLVDNIIVQLPTAAVLDGPANNEPRAEIDSELKWNAPPIGVVDHYVLYHRQGDPNFSDAGTTVVDPATSPYTGLGTMPYNTQYYWRVDVVDDGAETITGNAWTFTTAPEIPQIDVQPEGVVVSGDGTAEATFTLAGLNIVNYAWQKDGSPLSDVGNISGSATATLTVSGVTLADEGLYSCVVDNGKGDVDETTDAMLMTERLVAYWDFEGDLTDGIGGWTGLLKDPNEFNDDPDDSPYYTGGVIGQGFEITGNGFWITIPGSEEAFNFYNKGLTVNAWVKTPGRAYSTIISKRAVESDTGWMLRATGSAGFTLEGSSTGALSGGDSVIDDEWHMVTAQYDGENVKLYVDGILVDSGQNTNEIGLHADQLVIGAARANGTGFYLGVVDDIRIWSYAIDPVDIAYYYHDITDETLCIDQVGLEMFDITGPDGEPDCVVNIYDFAAFASDWLNCRLVPDCLADLR